MTSRRIFEIWALVVFISCGVPSRGQNSPAVQSVRAKTGDGVEFRVWLDDAGSGRDVVVHYEVRNHGSTAIYLVRDRIPKIALIDSNSTLLIAAPYPAEPKYSSFDYSFTLVNRGSRRRGEIKIPFATISDRDGPLPIRIAFGYVKDKSGLDSPRESGADAVLGGILKSRILIVALGELVLVKN